MQREAIPVARPTGALRWMAKKAARRCVAMGSGLVAAGGGAGRIRVLTYHRFGTRDRDPFTVAPASFAAQMAWLAARGLAVTLEHTLRVARGEAGVDRDRVLISIDDGWHSVMSDALPSLRAHRLPAVLFLSVGAIASGDAPAPGAAPPERAIDWSEAATLTAAGVTIGSHGWTHRSLAALSPADARCEVRRSRDELEQRLGVAVTSFAYPFGTRADFSARLAELLAECGYVCAFTAQHGAVAAGMPLFTLPRIKVEGGEPLAMFRRLCCGGLDAWGWVDHGLWRWQARPT